MSSVRYGWETSGHRYRLCAGGTRLEGWVELAPFEARWVLRSRLNDSDYCRSLICALRGHVTSASSTNLTDHGVLEREIERRWLVVLLSTRKWPSPSSVPARVERSGRLRRNRTLLSGLGGTLSSTTVTSIQSVVRGASRTRGISGAGVGAGSALKSMSGSA